MILLFLDRRPRKSDPWLRFKVGAFSAGAALALAGIYFDARWLVWVALAALLVGFAIRFLEGRGAPSPEERDPLPEEQEEVLEEREASPEERDSER